MLVSILKRGTSGFVFNCCNQVNYRGKTTIDISRVPVLVESDLEEQYVRGSGPGGQKVNKSSNCVVLKHIPSGIVIKCHESRLLQRNCRLAREILQMRLDDLVNGDMSVAAQKKRILEGKSRKREEKDAIRRVLKKEFKEREGLD